MLNLVSEPSSYSVGEALCVRWTKNDNCVCVVRYVRTCMYIALLMQYQLPVSYGAIIVIVYIHCILYREHFLLDVTCFWHQLFLFKLSPFQGIDSPLLTWSVGGQFGPPVLQI